MLRGICDGEVLLDGQLQIQGPVDFGVLQGQNKFSGFACMTRTDGQGTTSTTLNVFLSFYT